MFGKERGTNMKLETLIESCERAGVPPFETLVPEEYASTNEQLTNLQVNVGYRCNLACTHCFLDCGPNREECMSRETMEDVLRAFKKHGFKVLDITGGSPEMNPNLEWFIDEAAKIGRVIVRSNFAILEDPEYAHFIDVYNRNNVELFVSMSCSEEPTVDKVRGTGSYKKICSAWRKLNALGYARDPEKELNVLFTSAGKSLAPDQGWLSPIFKENIKKFEDCELTNLYCSTNVPLGRYGTRLERDGELDEYQKMLYDNFNPAGLPGMMCHYQMNVDYDGRIYECDSYHAMGADPAMPQTIGEVADMDSIPVRKITFSPVCLTCVAGAGSGCGGNTTA